MSKVCIRFAMCAILILGQSLVYIGRSNHSMGSLNEGHRHMDMADVDVELGVPRCVSPGLPASLPSFLMPRPFLALTTSLPLSHTHMHISPSLPPSRARARALSLSLASYSQNAHMCACMYACTFTTIHVCAFTTIDKRNRDQKTIILIKNLTEDYPTR